MVKKMKKITTYNAPRSEDLRYNYGSETIDDRIATPIKFDMTMLIVR